MGENLKSAADVLRVNGGYKRTAIPVLYYFHGPNRKEFKEYKAIRKKLDLSLAVVFLTAATASIVAAAGGGLMAASFFVVPLYFFGAIDDVVFHEAWLPTGILFAIGFWLSIAPDICNSALRKWIEELEKMAVDDEFFADDLRDPYCSGGPD